MVNKPSSGIQILPEAVRKVLAALTSDDAQIVANGYTVNLTRDFLLKRLRVQLQLEDFTDTRVLIFGFARGDMTIAEIASVLVTKLPDPEDFQAWDNFALNRGIFWETLQMITGIDTANVTSTPVYNWDFSIGGGKGIPLEAGHGIQSFVFNPDGITVGNAGSTILALYEYIGVFMEGSN